MFALTSLRSQQIALVTAGGPLRRAYGKAGNGNETETGIESLKWKPETGNKKGNRNSLL